MGVIVEELDTLCEDVVLEEHEGVSELIYEDDEGYYLEQEDLGKGGFINSVFTPDDTLLYRWKSFNDLRDIKFLKASFAYKIFTDEVRKYKEDVLGVFDDYVFSDEPGYFDDLPPLLDRKPVGSRGLAPYVYKTPAKKKGYLERLCKSDTLVFHRNDPTTTMLSQIYEGKGWDVLTESCFNIDDEELRQLFERHEKLVFLGHGTPGGLIGMFGGEVAPYMKGKKIFAIWCNANAYFERYGIGEGCFITKNVPSEVWECSAAGCGHISAQLMLENITYWSRLCADVVDRCLDGNDVSGAVDYVRLRYLEQYGNHPVSIYNADSTQVLGRKEPLPWYEFKGNTLQPKDWPVPNFDEEEFLLNPTPKASECPRLGGTVDDVEDDIIDIDLESDILK